MYFLYSSRSSGETKRFRYGLVERDCLSSTPRTNRSFASIFARRVEARSASSSGGRIGRSSVSPSAGLGEKDGSGREEGGAPTVERDGFPASGGVLWISRVFDLYFAGTPERSSVKWITPLSSSHR